jgi:hypothetical protein
LSFYAQGQAETGSKQDIDESDNFVTYAASTMLENLDEAARSIASSANTHSHVTLAARRGLMHLFPILHEFLNKPFLLSKWLFNFYRFTDARHPLCTAANAFADFIRRHWSGNILRDGSILLALDDLTGELGMIISSWGQKLWQRPEIIWDEMTSFINSRIFFNPGSTLVSKQGCCAATVLGVTAKPLTVVSRTTNRSI